VSVATQRRQELFYLEAAAAILAGEQGTPSSPFDAYRFEPERYIVEKLDWQPWRGTDDQPGQGDVLEAYALALRQQHERDDFEAGVIGEDDLTCWTPGQAIQNQIRVEAGHTVGKTKLASGIVNHFFDCFAPSIIYTFAPTRKQIHDLLWKEIKTDRSGKGLPGRILDLALDRGPDHFANGMATNNAGGMGTERVQGQHGKYLMFILDEAEGIADYVWDAIKSMMSGGIAIVLMLANPRTRISRFHKARELPSVRSFRISCIWHPNVLAGREIVPGAVRRDYVESMLDEHCEIVAAHDDDEQTFEVPWRPGVIFQPDTEMLFRVLGTAPKTIANNTLVPVGRYEAATKREPTIDRPKMARIGVDCARFGQDVGTCYIRHDGRIWREARFPQLTTGDYFRSVKDAILRLVRQGVTDVQVRVDGGGGFGAGLIDRLNDDVELSMLVPSFSVHEVHFGGTERIDATAYVDMVTQMYAEVAETIKGLTIVNPPAELEADLCERTYKWMNRGGVDVKKLAPKDEFKKARERSPDDGDGFVLAAAPDLLFGGGLQWIA
jgi:hypothetical protein